MLLNPRFRKSFLLCLAFLLVVAGMRSEPGAAEEKPGTVSEMSLEELMGLKITSVSRKEEDPFHAGAAVFVLTQEDIRRSGATSIPEALRLVPGVQVARLDANIWAITARGFNSRFASKLLVLIDGRSVYQTLFSGVYWDTQDTVLEDIDRIEVVRGPGSTLWGVNAVNGVINIITRDAANTQGGLVSLSGGKEERGIGSFRYGGKLSEEAAFRVYGKYFNRDRFSGTAGQPAADDWHAARGGFRLDWKASPENDLTFLGETYDGESGDRALNRLTTLTPPTPTSFNQDNQVDGGHFLARVKHRVSASQEWSLQFFFNRERRANSTFEKATLDTYDLDFQHRFELAKNHDFIWGIGQRFIADSFENRLALGLMPDSRFNYISSAFIQDEYLVIPDRLRLVAGSKFSGNNYTGFEFQPSARVIWTPHRDHVFWGAVSRAVRIPSRVEDSSIINTRVVPTPGVGFSLLALQGRNNFESEDLLSFEAGYRVQLNPNIRIDLAGYANFYDDLRTLERGPSFLVSNPPPLHGVVPFFAENRGSAEVFGGEMAVDWQVLDWWKLKGGLNFIETTLFTESNSTDTTLIPSGMNDPEFQWNLRSQVDLPWSLEFDSTLYYVDNLGNRVPDYLRLDLRLGWKPTRNLDLSVVVQNAQGESHQEFGVENVQFTSRSLVERAIFGRLTWTFGK